MSSSIFGCWQVDGAPINVAAAGRCVAQLNSRRAIPSVWTNGDIALGSKQPRSSRPVDAPCVTAGGSRCVFDGRLDNRAELQRALADDPAVTTDCADETLVLAAYARFGNRFPEHLAGDFVAAIFDRRSRQLLIARDQLGVRPLCYAMLGRLFLFASDAKALLHYPGMKAAPDDTMLADFILSFRSSDACRRTFFENIETLPAAHLLIATAAGLTIRRYFDFDATRRIRFPVFHDYAHAFHELFVNAVRRRIRAPHSVGVSVSGGLDSAYIFCVARQLAGAEADTCPAIFGYNYEGAHGSPSDEREFVEALDGGGAQIERISERAGFIECAAADIWTAESPMVDRLARQARAGLEAVRARGAARILTGHWGDQLLFDSDYLLDLLFSGRWRRLRRHAARWRVDVRQLAGRAFRHLAVRCAPGTVVSAARRRRGGPDAPWRSPWFTERFRQLLREGAGHERFASIGTTWHASSMYRESRMPYHVQCMEWNTRIASAQDLDIAFPYLDCDVIQFLMGIPGDMQSYDGTPRGLMRAAMRDVVPPHIATRRGKGEFTHLANEGIRQEFPAILRLFEPPALSVELGYVDGAVLRGHLEQWRSMIGTASDATLTNRIVDLCGLELFLRVFLGADTTGAAALAAAETATC